MCTPSGGDGGAAARAAAQQAQQDAGISKINGLFGIGNSASKNAREALYAGVGADATVAMRNQSAPDQASAQRNVDFNLARQGLLGGSEQINQQANLDRATQNANLQIQSKANDIVTGLRQSDDAAKNAAINSITAGVNSTAATDNALSAQSQNLSNASKSANLASAGSMFGNFGDQYSAYNQSLLNQKALNGMQGASANTANNGIATK